MTAPLTLPTPPQLIFSNVPSLLFPSLPQPTATNLCEHCKAKPKHVDGIVVHKYCCKTCALNASIVNANQAANSNASSQSSSSSLCTVCNLKPRHVDASTGKVHIYCGKRCASKAHHSTGSGSHPAGSICAIPGCNKAVFKDSNGTPTKFCSKTHKKVASEACLMCRKAAKQSNNFCSRQCTANAQALSPAILEVPEEHVVFKSVSEQFKSSWRHPNKKCPEVKHVYKIISTKASVDQYEAYRDAVEARGNFAKHGRSAGNENRRWHGTRRECTLGEKGSTQFCGSSSCSLCNIVKTSFDLAFFGKKTSWGRFGAGIYTSSTSSKADDYSNNVNQSSLKAVLLNKVIVGKGAKLTHDDPNRSGPPAGHDSVLGEKGGNLNYDELVVYTNDAIRPSYLVMFDN
ncbi:ADP-ribosylation [Schizopora paradoxa]|uniref:ADP-ribosylation n=1 Tax=Schizopora paradoxa TaxID=27342 RepID=A0A0H2RTQ1_9AGAM|nr:ADP-ribosylation [Schizopora paradoxa]